MKIFYNSKPLETSCQTLWDFANEQGFDKRDAVVVLNGFQVNENENLSENDNVFLSRRGKMPPQDELEALMYARHTPKVHDAVKNAVVGIAGLGGLGSNIAIMLARLGVGKLIVADFDVVEPTNLGRQQYFVSHLGMKKTDAMRDLIKNINPYINVQTADVFIDEVNCTSVFSDCDIVCEAFDSAQNKAMLITTLLCENKSVKVVSGNGMAGFADSNEIKTHVKNERFVVCGDLKTAAENGVGLMSPRVSICAGHQANAVLQLLVNGYLDD